MGIKGLTKLIQANAERSYKEQPIKAYFGRTVAIDATMALYQFLIAVRFGSEGSLSNENGEVTSHIIGIFYRTIRMMENGIKPVYVFDGKPPDFKSHELKKRKARRDKARTEMKEAEEAGDEAKVIQMEKRLTKVTPQNVEDTKTLLTAMGIPWVHAPGEAEAQCATMCADGLVYGTATEDMDALTFGTSRLLRHLTYSAARKVPVMEFNLQTLLDSMEFTMDQFIDVCILCGCDYVPSIRGIGPKKAFEYITKWGDIEGVIENVKDMKKFTIPENWQFATARELFKKPDVTASKEITLKFKDPDEPALIEFLVHQKAFSQERVEKGISRMKKCKSKGSQKRLDSFFKVMPSPALKNKKNKKNAKKTKGKGTTKGKGATKGKEKVSGKKRKYNKDETNNGHTNKKTRTSK